MALGLSDFDAGKYITVLGQLEGVSTEISTFVPKWHSLHSAKKCYLTYFAPISWPLDPDQSKQVEWYGT